MNPKREPIVSVDDVAPPIIKKANIQTDVNPIWNIITVRMAPQSGEFSSTHSALSAIPTSGPNAPSERNRYMIFVHPGTYGEPSLIIPSWIELHEASSKFNEGIMRQVIGRVTRVGSHRRPIKYALYDQ